MRKLLAGIFLSLVASTFAADKRPNILFIAVDDLNDWIGCMGGHPQTITPNFDRLAASGMLFNNAHCAAPACNPSRTAVMTGLSPHRSGLYANGQKMREILPDAKLMPVSFADNGYWTGGSGKMLHYFIDAHSWQDYFPDKEKENPFPFTLYPEKRPVSLPRGGPWQYVETDWGGLDVDDKTFGGDYAVSEWVNGQLKREHDKPFFLACGIYRPHEPWFVPQKYFEPFPLESIQLPAGYKADDLDDLPPSGKRRGPNRYFAHIQKHGQWKQAIQGYLASIHFADAMLGRVLDTLDNSDYADNTIVVLWSDHGWHLGEKQHWQKFSPWRVATRVPMMFRVPKGVPGLAAGTTPGSICEQPVSLLDLYPTLLALCGLPAKADNHGRSLVPLLADSQASWPHYAHTFLGDGESVAISGPKWRYIRYGNGDEELYNIARDKHEWTNLATNPEAAPALARMQKAVPAKFAKYVPPSTANLPKLKWHPIKKKPAPPSRPDGHSFEITFVNATEFPAKLYWVDREGGTKFYTTILPGKEQRQNSRPGAVWQISSDADQPRGYFVVGDRPARAVVE